MAKFLEYQGKEYFKKAGIPVPEGEVVDTAEAAAAAIDLTHANVLARVHLAGRAGVGLVGVHVVRRAGISRARVTFDHADFLFADAGAAEDRLTAGLTLGTIAGISLRAR